jgi:hypothetical protein
VRREFRGKRLSQIRAIPGITRKRQEMSWKNENGGYLTGKITGNCVRNRWKFHRKSVRRQRIGYRQKFRKNVRANCVSKKMFLLVIGKRLLQ